MLLDDAARNPQAEAGSGVFFCSVERLENVVQVIAGNSAAIVCNGNADSISAIAPVVASRDADMQRAFVFHGIDRIHQKICQQLPHFAGIAFDVEMIAVAPVDANSPAE